MWGATNIEEANNVLRDFLPRYNRRFRVPPHCTEAAFRPLDPELCLVYILGFKHSRRVAKDNTVKFQMHTLQLLPGPERPSYAGTLVEVLEGLYRRLTVQNQGLIIPTQEAPPSPVFLRNGQGSSAGASAPPSSAHSLGQRWASTLEHSDTVTTAEIDQGSGVGMVVEAGKPTSAATRKPTFLQRERWKAIQKARRKGMSLRAIDRDLGIHRDTIKKCMEHEGPPTRQSRSATTTSPSGTIAV